MTDDAHLPPAGPGPLFLASAECDGLADWLRRNSLPGPTVVITSASADVPDRDGIVGPLVAAAASAGAIVRLLDPASDPVAAIGDAGAVVMPGGDPYRLLRVLRDSGGAELLVRRHREGMPVAGQSAGAMVCGPTLAPALLTSPFSPAPGQSLEGLALTRRLVLPHHDRQGRAARHFAAAFRYGRTVALAALWDDELLVEDPGGWHIQRGAISTRPARAADGPAVGAVFRAAATAAWAPFLGEARLRAAPEDTSRWIGRIDAAGERFLVAEDASGILGFVLFGAAPDDDLDPESIGEVDLLYTLPRAWSLGIGRRLLDRAALALAAAGYRAAVLWTEHRNERALDVYRQNGWVLDGQVRERDYLGARIRELRHRVDLRARAE